ncbi:DUF6382 domain-containing protein [Eisenbergiella sp.]
MVKPVYRRELSHSYLVIEGIPKEKTDSYQYQMILKNKISGLLEAGERYVDGKVCLYYDISSRQSLEQIYEAGKMTCQEILDVVDSLSGLLEGMAGYLLEERFLLLEPAWIYMDLETERLCFLYYPFAEKEKPIGSIYMPIAEFFLEHVDHREENAVNAAYQFYKMSKAENFTIESFRVLLEKGETDSPGARQESRPDIRQGHSPARSRGIEGTAEIGYPQWQEDSWGNQMSFYEEPAVYEFSRTEPPASYEEILYKEKSIHSMDNTGAEAEKNNTSPKGEPAKKRGNKNLIGLAISVLLFGIICVVIWYLQPEGTLKTALFVGLAADGITLLLFLWKLTAAREEKKGKAEEEKKQEGTWDSYAGCDENVYCDDTIFCGNNGGGIYGMSDIPGNGTKSPRLIGKLGEQDICFTLSSLPAIAGKMKGRAQLLLPDVSVSRIHARFIEKEGRTALMDLNSTNGTFINGIGLEQNETVVLEAGDEIRLGNVILHYEE